MNALRQDNSSNHSSVIRVARPMLIIAFGLLTIGMACTLVTAQEGPPVAPDVGEPGAEGPPPIAANFSSYVTVPRATLLVGSFTVFLLAVFVGFEVITKVPPTLHTPLMSGSNAISGITIVGAMLTAGNAAGGFGSLLGMVAVVLAAINVVGGFLVTHRMLKMFKKR